MSRRKTTTGSNSPKASKPALRVQRQTLRDLQTGKKAQPKGGIRACTRTSNDIT